MRAYFPIFSNSPLNFLLTFDSINPDVLTVSLNHPYENTSVLIFPSHFCSYSIIFLIILIFSFFFFFTRFLILLLSPYCVDLQERGSGFEKVVT